MFFHQSLKDMSSAIQSLMKAEVERQGVKVLHISGFGYLFDAAFWIAVKTDEARDRLSVDQALIARLKGFFIQKGYAEQVRKEHGEALAKINSENLLDIGIVFESQETVDRDYQGNWWYAMK